jgi:glutathione S-transferase
MKLYGGTISPFVRMCLITAHELGLGDRLQHVPEAVNPTTVNPVLTALSPIGKVPVLETDHGHGLYDSRVIIEYLCHVAGNSTLIPDDGVKRFRVLTLQALGQGLAEAGVATRYEVAARPPGLQWKEWLERARQRMTAALDDLEANWGSVLAEVNAGSIAVAAALSYFDFRLPDLPWNSGRPKLAAFHKDFVKRPSMIATDIKV